MAPRAVAALVALVVAGAIGPVPAADAAPAQVAGYDLLLRRTVTRGFVDYAALGRPEGRQALSGYLLAIERARIDDEGDSRGRLAAWLNAYNALVLKGILDGGSPSTLWGRFTFFKRDTHRVYGRELTLDALENEVIRKAFSDARVHFALVCASKSCPPLRSEAYAGPKLDRQLDDQAVTFLGDGSKNRFDRGARAMQLSSIFKWYQADFERDAGTLPAFVSRFAPAAARGWLVEPGVATTFLDYDWTLNGRR